MTPTITSMTSTKASSNTRPPTLPSRVARRGAGLADHRRADPGAWSTAGWRCWPLPWWGSSGAGAVHRPAPEARARCDDRLAGRHAVAGRAVPRQGVPGGLPTLAARYVLKDVILAAAWLVVAGRLVVHAAVPVQSGSSPAVTLTSARCEKALRSPARKGARRHRGRSPGFGRASGGFIVHHW
jgi:hypothetical protein